MKFDQLIEFNMRNIFLQKLYTNGSGEKSHDVHPPSSSTSKIGEGSNVKKKPAGEGQKSLILVGNVCYGG